MADICNPNIDFVIETLFYSYAKEEDALVRKAAIGALDILHRRSSEARENEQLPLEDVEDPSGRSNV
jgi:hypothetical protein